jgi:hypothetical protein
MLHIHTFYNKGIMSPLDNTANPLLNSPLDNIGLPVLSSLAMNMPNHSSLKHKYMPDALGRQLCDEFCTV